MKLIALIFASFLLTGMAERAWSQPSPIPQEQPADKKTDTERDRSYEKSNDDEAQKSEKWWNRLVGWMNVNNGFVSGVLAFFIMIFTGVLAAVGRKQIKDTRILQRAYISVEGLGIEPLSYETETVAHISVRNRGRLPAREISWFIDHKFSNNGSEKNFLICDKFYGGSLVIPPDTEMRRSQNCMVDRATLQKFIKSPRELFFYVWGEIKYTDGFGASRHTLFCHRYDSRGLYSIPEGQPHGPHLAISGESMRLHQHGNDAT